MLLPKKTQRFLRRTAVLDQMSARLCDAVLGESGGQVSRAIEICPEAVVRPAR
jgi:LuxR family maltose regulon positive regulatory protein